jgi:hypothetical protein
LALNAFNPPRALHESTVILDFLEECVHPKHSSLVKANTRAASLQSPHIVASFRHQEILVCEISVVPKALTLSFADAKALVRLQSDHINRTLVPAFYRYLQAQDSEAQIAGGKEFDAAIQYLVELFERAEREVGGTGLWVEGGDLGWADVIVGPCGLMFCG